MKVLYDLDPEVTFLNHGSYGAVAKPLKDVQRHWQNVIDQNPDQFIRDQWPEIWDQSRAKLGEFLNAKPEQLGFVANATAGLQAAALAAPIKQGQRILIHSHIYNALRNQISFVAELRGATVEMIDLPLNTEAAEVMEAELATRLDSDVGLVVIDHISSPTAVTFPIEAITAACRSAGVPVLIDGAHGPGHRDIDLNTLDPDWYVGNGHKWLGAPRGTAFIWANEKWLDATQSPLVSHGYQQGFDANFIRYGTIDFSAWSTVSAVLDCYGRLDQRGAFAHARTILQHDYAEMVSALGATAITKASDPGMMAAMLLPETWKAEQAEPIRHRLQDNFKIVNVPIPQPNGRLILRLSAYGYTDRADFARLTDAMRTIAA